MSEPTVPTPPDDQPLQVTQPPSLPTTPQPPLLSGWTLAAWSVIYLLTWWFVFAGLVGHDLIIYQLALLGLCGEGVYFFVTGGAGHSVASWWRARSGAQKTGVGCLVLCFWPVVFLVLPFWPIRPLFKATQAHYASTQQRPSQQAQVAWQRIQAGSRQFQVGVAAAALVGVCALCSTTGVVVGHSNAGFFGDNSTTLATDTGNGNTQSTNQAATDTPVPTETLYVPPTYKSGPPPTATPEPKWTTIQSFSGNGNKKTPVFTVNADSWRLVWSCTPSSSYFGSYNVMVDVNYSDGTSADMGAVNTICKAGNTSDFTEERVNGDLYLDVTSEAAWTMQIQVLK